METPIQQSVEPTASNVEPTPITTAPAPSTPAPDATPPLPAAASAPSPTGEPVAPAPFKTDFKFKVMDKEHEIPKWAQDGIKDEATFKQAKEIWEKAMGLDIVKPKYTETKAEVQTLKKSVAEYEGTVNELRQHYKNGDLDNFFQTMNIDPEKVLQWAVNKAKLSQLPEDQRRLYDEKVQAQRTAFQAQKQVQTVEEQSMQRLQELTTAQLQSTLDRDDVKKFVTDFETRAGKPGLFQQLVTQQGEMAWQQGHYLQPADAVKAVMEHYGPFLAGGTTPQANGGAASVQPAGAAQTSQVPVIPAIGGGKNTSPVSKPKVKSIADLKKLSAQFGN